MNETKVMNPKQNKRSGSKISFFVWFQRIMQKGEHPKLKVNHRDAIWAYFNGMGLSEFEESAVFDECLTKFGI